MWDRIKNGVSMAVSSYRVIMADKKLLLFPIISGIVLLVMFLSFLIPSVSIIGVDKLGNGQAPTWFYVGSFVLYFLAAFVIVFFNAALVSCALLRFNGQTATLGDGFRAAWSRLPQIFAWALVSGTVGLLLNAIEQAHEKVGYYVRLVLGAAWAIMTYFVIPIIVVEKTGPFAAIGRSTSLIKKTWGEALVGKVGIGLFLFLVFLVIFLPLTILLGFMAQAGGAMLYVAVAIWIVAFVIYVAFGLALKMVFLSAVYQFAAHDSVPEGFDRHTMADAFGTK